MKNALILLSCCLAAVMAYTARYQPQISLVSVILLGAVGQAIFSHWMYTTGLFDENYRMNQTYDIRNKQKEG